MGMEINYEIGNGNGNEWELTGWECEGIGMQKAIPGHLYSLATHMTRTKSGPTIGLYFLFGVFRTKGH